MKNHPLAVAIWALCLAAAGAWGQYPMNTGPTGVPGRVLDSPLNVTPAPAGPSTPLNTGPLFNGGNALITDNVRFGRGFEGRIGYANPYAFRGPLGSSALNAFRAQSLTYADLLAGTVPLAGAVPYYPTNSTILSPRDVEAGRARLGTNQPYSSGEQPTSIGAPLDLRVGMGQEFGAVSATGGAAPLPLSDYYKEAVRPEVGLPTRSTLSLQGEGMVPALPTAPAPGEEAPPGRGYVSPYDPRLTQPQVSPLLPTELSAAGSRVQDLRVQPPAALAPSPAAAPAPKGEDVYQDLRTLLGAGEQGTAQTPSGGPPDLWAPIEPGPAEIAPAAPPPTPAEGERRVTIDTFVGSKPTPLNEYLREGEKLMKSGEYERAVGKYSVASISNPDNPLPQLGWANALFGQRMYSAAAFHLKAAFARFPKLADVDMDLPRFFPSRPAYAQILLDLIAELKKTNRQDDPNLHLVLAYAFNFSGRPADAVRHLNAILKANPQDEIAKTFLQSIAARAKTSPAAEN